MSICSFLSREYSKDPVVSAAINGDSCVDRHLNVYLKFSYDCEIDEVKTKFLDKSFYGKDRSIHKAFHSISVYQKTSENGESLSPEMVDKMIKDHLFFIDVIANQSVFETSVRKKTSEMKSELYNVMTSFLEIVTPHLSKNLEDDKLEEVMENSISKIIQFGAKISDDVKPIYYYALYRRSVENEIMIWEEASNLAIAGILELKPNDRRKVFNRIIDRYFITDTHLFNPILKNIRDSGNLQGCKELESLISDYKKIKFYAHEVLLAYFFRTAKRSSITKKITEVNIEWQSTVKNAEKYLGYQLDEDKIISELEKLNFISFETDDVLRLTEEALWIKDYEHACLYKPN